MAQYTTAQVAAKFETTPRTLRKFLRADAAANESTDTLPGKGSRYAIEGKDLAAMKKRFKAWAVADAEDRAERAAKRAEDAAAKVEVIEVEDEAQDSTEIDGPSDADIAALEGDDEVLDLDD